MGLDLVEYSKFLVENGIETLGVANVYEAVTLRENGIKCNILMLSEVYSEEEIDTLIKQDVILTIGSLLEKKKIEEISKKLDKIAQAHIKIDTGFARYGFIYNNDEIFEAVKDTDNLKANEIRLSDALPHLSSTKLQTGDYVKKTKVKAYVAATAKTKGALKVVSDKKKPAANEIRFSNVKYRVYSVEIKEGDYVAVEEIDAYVATTADDKDALKVVADFRTLEAGQIKISSARPFIDTNPIKVGDYVIEGTYVTDTSKVVCKQG